MVDANSIPKVQCFLETLLKKEARFTSKKAKTISEQFQSFEFFMNTDFSSVRLNSMESKKEIKMTKSNREKIQDVKKYIYPDATITENWIRFTTHFVTSKILRNISTLTLDHINVNPFLIRTLHLRTPEEILRFNVYQTISRSIVTSMGTSLEYMIADSGGRRGKKGEWYDVIKKTDQKTYWIQVKSGPNNIDKDQIQMFSNKFDKTEETSGNHTRLGIVYGKRELSTISLEMVKKYMRNWNERLLVGKELWDFMSGERNYHKKVLSWIDQSVANELKDKSIDDMIQEAIKRLVKEFKSEYGDGEKGIQKYIDDII